MLTFAQKLTTEQVITMMTFLLKNKKFWGITSICAGVLLLAVSYLAGWTIHNWLLIFYLFLVLAGVIIHVVVMKQESKY